MAVHGAGKMGTSFGHLAGAWRGTNGFRLMPSDEMHDAPASAQLGTAADGHDLVLTYTWTHPADGPQDGLLVVGSPEDERDVVTAVWGDSWHQKPAMLMLAGIVTSRRLEVSAEYGGGWRWAISLDGERDDRLTLTMDNVIPPEQGTDDVPAGPYPVMVAAMRRASD